MLGLYLIPFLSEAIQRLLPRVDLLGHVALAVIGLALVEQLFRNTRPEHRWAIKFLCIGVGGLFAYDFFLYADGLLFRQLDFNLWGARGYVHIMVVPLLAVSAARNPQWSGDVFVSRKLVFHTMALLGSGIYLLVMAAGGYYLRRYGGHWGVMIQVVFLFGATLVLLLLLFSGRLRAQVKLFLNQHFFHYRYDYREEWLRFTRTLSAEVGPPRERAIQALAAIVESPGGCLWWRQEIGIFYPSAYWNLPCTHALAHDHALVGFLQARDWVIDLDEVDETPEVYEGLKLPEWLKELPRAWLVVPLMLEERLAGFMVLAASRAPRRLHWEDSDLLKTAGRQAASHLAQYEASEALVVARQFEAFHQLSAFVVHDLKNLIAQLSLLVANAGKYKRNPLFMDDVISTVENAVGRMNRLLTQLRTGTPGTITRSRLALLPLLEEVVATKSQRKPIPTLEGTDQYLRVMADPEQLAKALGHLLQNAQEATPAEGQVRVRLKRQGGCAVIEIEDTGCGMDERFIQQRLFRPFDTTKGRAGMGIGAYESRELVRQMGGEIEVESVPGRGSRFRVRLPLGVQPEVEPEVEVVA
jgi:putative PEP-CTERM system histidine kinase